MLVDFFELKFLIVDSFYSEALKKAVRMNSRREFVTKPFPNTLMRKMRNVSLPFLLS